MSRILKDEEIKPVLPLRDGYYYYEDFARKIAELQDAKTKAICDRENAEAIQQLEAKHQAEMNALAVVNVESKREAIQQAKRDTALSIFAELRTHQVPDNPMAEPYRGVVVMSKDQFEALRAKYLEEKKACPKSN